VQGLYPRVLSDPGDAAAWRALAAGFARAGQAGRSAACLDALEVADPEAPPPADARALRAQATREGVARRRDLFARLVAPDAIRVSAVVVGDPDAEPTRRTLAALGDQTVAGDGGLEIHLVADRCDGLRRATGRYVAHLEAGDEPWPDHLAVLSDHLDRTGRAMTFSRTLRPGPDAPHATNGTPVLPREARHAEFAPCAAVLHRRRALVEVGGFEPHLGRGQAWHLWSRFVDRLRADAVPVLTARVEADDAAPARRFDLLLVRLGSVARARRHHRRARAHLARGDASLAARALGQAWNLGLAAEAYVASAAAVAEHSRSLAADLVALGAGEVEPHVRGVFRRIARGAEARRTLARRTHRHALRTLYREAEARGRARARAFGWRDESSGPYED